MSADFNLESIIAAVMKDRPEAVAVLLRNRMHCPGCFMAPFMTLSEGAESHGIDPDALLAELCAAVPAEMPENVE